MGVARTMGVTHSSFEQWRHGPIILLLFLFHAADRSARARESDSFVRARLITRVYVLCMTGPNGDIH